jgi:hypothetical protein
MAVSVEKKTIKAGSSNVPSPNPEKKVKNEAKREISPILINSIVIFSFSSLD